MTETVPATAEVAALLELSRERDVQVLARHEAWRDGWRACEAELGDRYELGFADGCLAVKRVQHDLHRLAQEYGRRWAVRGEPRSQEGFSQPHPADHAGGPVAIW